MSEINTFLEEYGWIILIATIVIGGVMFLNLQTQLTESENKFGSLADFVYCEFGKEVGKDIVCYESGPCFWEDEPIMTFGFGDEPCTAKEKEDSFSVIETAVKLCYDYCLGEQIDTTPLDCNCSFVHQQEEEVCE